MFNKTFFHFVLGFVTIIGAAFVVITVAGQYAPQPVDSVATPQ